MKKLAVKDARASPLSQAGVLRPFGAILKLEVHYPLKILGVASNGLTIQYGETICSEVSQES